MEHSEKFLILEHTADLKIRVFGKTIQELFRNALIGMFQSIKPQVPGCFYNNNYLICPHLPITREISLTSFDLDTLLIDFLNEALYLSDVYNEAYLDAEITCLEKTTLNALIYGIQVERFEVVEIKAVTYHGGVIKKDKDLFQVDILFDV